MMNELKAARAFLTNLWSGKEAPAVLCAVSGGLDSMCLLHLLTAWGRGQKVSVTAAHFNHQLRGAESDRDEAFVQGWCEAHDVPFVCGRGDVQALAKEAGLTTEEAARTMRYAFLEEQRCALGGDFILTAHHADDSAETMLLNLLRGTGIRGLTGIPAVRGAVARPFLHHTHEELAAYAAEHDIPHVEDGTNALDDAARNVLRHKVLPVLRELNPRAVENMTRTAQLLADDDAALESAAAELLEKVQMQNGKAVLDVSDLLRVKQAVLSRCVRAMLVAVGGHEKDLTAAHVEAVCALTQGTDGREVSLPYDMCAGREGGRLIVWKRQPTPEEIPLQIGETVIFGAWQVELSRKQGERGIVLPQDARLSVTAWSRADRMMIPGSRGERSFKRLCAERGITPAERDLLPVLRVNGKAAAAPGVGLDLEFTPQEDAVVFLTFKTLKKTEEKMQ